LKDARPPPADSEEPVARLTTAKGALTVWTQDDGDYCFIAATYGSATPKVIRRTSGHVTDVKAVTMADGDIAVAWVSSLARDKGQVAAVAFTGVDLGHVGQPVQLALLGKTTDRGHIALVRSPRGGVVVAHEGPTVACNFMGHPDECVSAEVEAVAIDHTVDTLGVLKLDGGPSPDLWLVDLEARGLLAYASSMRGGRTFASTALPWTSAEKPPAFEPPSCNGIAGATPDILRGTGGEVVCLDTDTRLGDKTAQCIRPLRGDADRCLRIGVTRADGTPLTPRGTWDTPVGKVSCVDKKVKLGFSGGAVTLATPSSHTDDFLAVACK
ncbi:MAG TPA: hypothetical protein VM925_06910, partial [Labilithrix sp.]|nr:hypothetical protein [Labilithrix sp.]